MEAVALGRMSIVDQAEEERVSTFPLPPSCAARCWLGSFNRRMRTQEQQHDLYREPDDITCAICLNPICPVDLAVVKGCEHNYCVSCILHW